MSEEHKKGPIEPKKPGRELKPKAVSKYLRHVITMKYEDVNSYISPSERDKDHPPLLISIDPKIDPEAKDSALLTPQQLHQVAEEVRKFLAAEMGVRVAHHTDFNDAVAFKEELEEYKKYSGRKKTINLAFDLPGATQRGDTIVRNAEAELKDPGMLKDRVDRELRSVQIEYADKIKKAKTALEDAAAQAYEAWGKGRNRH